MLDFTESCGRLSSFVQAAVMDTRLGASIHFSPSWRLGIQDYSADSVSVRVCCLEDGLVLTCPQRWKGALWGLFFEGTDPTLGCRPPDLISSQRRPLLTPSHCALGAQRGNWEAQGTNIPSTVTAVFLVTKSRRHSTCPSAGVWVRRTGRILLSTGSGDAPGDRGSRE